MNKYELIGKIKVCAEKQLHEKNVYDNCQTIIDMNYEMQHVAMANKFELDNEMDGLLRQLANMEWDWGLGSYLFQ